MPSLSALSSSASAESSSHGCSVLSEGICTRSIVSSRNLDTAIKGLCFTRGLNAIKAMHAPSGHKTEVGHFGLRQAWLESLSPASNYYSMMGYCYSPANQPQQANAWWTPPSGPQHLGNHLMNANGGAIPRPTRLHGLGRPPSPSTGVSLRCSGCTLALHALTQSTRWR